jgi:hypothetical protein
MPQTLTAINHTTVEALGFVPISESHAGVDRFARNNVIVCIDNNGDYSVSKNDKSVLVSTLTELKYLLK